MNTSTLVSIIIASLSIIINIITLININKTKKMIKQTMLHSYETQRKVSTINALYEGMNEEVESLSSSFTQVNQSFTQALDEKINMKHYPLPDEISNIEKTIQDQIETILRLSKDKVAKKDYFETIVRNVCITFPSVSNEYIVTKVSSIIESM